MEQRVSISISDGIADVRLVRADKMNALDAAMFEALVAATERLAHEKASGWSYCPGKGGHSAPVSIWDALPR
jgi:enoyl-CoA hydratase/carnithine racemase